MADNLQHKDLNSLFIDIADSIRQKSGSSESIVADEFPVAIANIPSGGGGDLFFNVEYIGDFETEITDSGGPGFARHVLHKIQFPGNTWMLNDEAFIIVSRGTIIAFLKRGNWSYGGIGCFFDEGKNEEPATAMGSYTRKVQVYDYYGTGVASPITVSVYKLKLKE